MILSVCIASIGRPSLLRTVESVVDSIAYSGICDSEIVVVNDGEENGIFSALRGAANAPLRVIHLGGRNISEARNACLAAARGEWIAFIDDDELAPSSWLDTMLKFAAEHSADVVCGCVEPIYPPGTSHFMRKLRPFAKRWGQPGQRITRGSTSNVLLRRSALDLHRIRFAPDFGSTGGEDSNLFMRLAKAGGVIIASDCAVMEEVPAERLQLPYLLRRAVAAGHALARAEVTIGNRSRAATLAEAMLKSVAYLSACILTAAVSPTTAAKRLIRAAEHIGRQSYALGLGGLHHR